MWGRGTDLSSKQKTIQLKRTQRCRVSPIQSGKTIKFHNSEAVVCINSYTDTFFITIYVVTISLLGNLTAGNKDPEMIDSVLTTSF